MSHSQKPVIATLIIALGGIGIYFNPQSRAASMPELQVSASFRHGLLQKNIVAEFNSGNSPDMAMGVEVVDPARHGRGDT
jgi:hypothetical protein